MNYTQNLTFNIIQPAMAQLPDNAVCMIVDNRTIALYDKLAYGGIYEQLIGKVFVFSFVAVVISIYTFWKYKKYLESIDIFGQSDFLMILISQMILFINITGLKQLLEFNLFGIILFFVLLFPFFYVTIIYAIPIFNKIYDKLNLFKTE